MTAAKSLPLCHFVLARGSHSSLLCSRGAHHVQNEHQGPGTMEIHPWILVHLSHNKAYRERLPISWTPPLGGFLSSVVFSGPEAVRSFSYALCIPSFLQKAWIWPVLLCLDSVAIDYLFSSMASLLPTLLALCRLILVLFLWMYLSLWVLSFMFTFQSAVCVPDELTVKAISSVISSRLFCYSVHQKL